MKRRRLLANAIALFTVPFVGTERTKAQTPAHQFVPGFADGGEIGYTINWHGDFEVTDDFTVTSDWAGIEAEIIETAPDRVSGYRCFEHTGRVRYFDSLGNVSAWGERGNV